MGIARKFEGRPAVIIGTGPSLAGQADAVRASGAILVGVNNTYQDFALDAWIACNAEWHAVYSPVAGGFDKWHWDRAICSRYGYQYIEGRWGDGLSLDPSFIHYGHSSGYQALNLAVLYGCGPIYLAGFDMRYPPGRRHYFDGLSDDAGEYPQGMRKYSSFDGLLRCYQTIADQASSLPRIINTTPDSALRCFEFGELPKARG